MCTVQRIQFHKSFLRLLWIFNSFFSFGWCLQEFFFPLSYFEVCITFNFSSTAMPMQVCISFNKKKLLSSSNIRQKKLAIWCGFLGRNLLWSLLQNISSSKHSVLYHISQNKKDALKLHEMFVSSNCNYISTIVVSHL